MSNITEKKNAKRAKIIESAISLFSENNFSSTAIDDIVKMAGVAKGTFYLYFKDKYDLLEQIMIYRSFNLLNEAISDVESKATKDTSMPDRLLMLVNYVEDFLIAHLEFTALIDKKLSCCFRMVANDKNSEFKDMEDKLTAPFINDGYSKEEAMKLIYIITDMIGSICCDAILVGSPFKIEEIRPLLNKSILKLVKKDD